MKRKGWQFWVMLAGLYVLLMSPIVGLVIAGHINRDPNLSLASLLMSAAYVVWLPLQFVIAMMLIWNMVPLFYWFVWQIRLIIERITGLQVGTRFSESIVSSSYFKYSKQGWPAQSLYRRVVARTAQLRVSKEKLQNNA